MAMNMDSALALMKAYLNRLEGDTSLDEVFRSRLADAEAELIEAGIHLREESERDLNLMVDTAIWHYKSRDSATGMPESLRLRRRERWLQERRLQEGEQA